MKLNKIVLPLALALVAMLATTGCKHGFNGKTTLLPSQRHEVASFESPPPTLQAGNTFNPGDTGNGAGVNTANNKPGGGELPSDWDPINMNQDPEKLKAFTVHFKFDSAVVQDNEQSNVGNVAQALNADMTAKLLIQGYCDERGTEEYNRALGERRALALREALAKIGVDAMRIRTISFGKDQPIDPAHDEAAWSKNRRGQFVYCTPKLVQ